MLKMLPLLSGFIFSFTATAESTLPKVIVNHDLYIHTGKPLEASPTNQSTLSYTENYDDTNAFAAADLATTAISDNQKEITSLGAAFSLNGTYGQHQLGYWQSPDPILYPTYRDWLRDGLIGALGSPKGAHYFANGFFDTLLVHKLNGMDLFTEILNKTSTAKPTILSVRLNDHHHTIDAAEVFNGTISDTDLASAPFSRRAAALTPEYKNFYSDSNKLVDDQNAFGAGCRADSKQLNFADPNVILQKQREILSLIDTYFTRLDGIELDFMRNNCFFRTATALSTREYRMHTNLLAPIKQKISQMSADNGGKKFFLILRLPLDEVEKVNGKNEIVNHGIKLSRLASEGGIDGIIFAYSQPYLSSQVVTNPMLDHPLNTAKVYYELYNINDSQPVGSTSQRRPATTNEIASTAYEAYYAGYNGMSLFNFHYIFKDNANLKDPGNNFSWQGLFNFIDDQNVLKTMSPRFFFATKNAAGAGNNFVLNKANSVTTDDSAIVNFRFRPLNRTLAPKATIRVILEGHNALTSAQQTSWNRVIFKLKINGSYVMANGAQLSLANSTSTSPGWLADPVNQYEDTTVIPWGYPASKEAEFNQPAWDSLNQSVEIIPVSDPDGFLNVTRKVQVQLSL